MNEKNKALIETVPAAGELRKVQGFNPLRFLHQTVSRTGEKVLKLDLPYKKLWFRLACPNGRMLLNPLRITDQMAIFEAKIYFSRDDLSPAASFTSTQMARDVPGGLYIRAAQDEALNEALDNAGFGIQLCDVAQVSDGSGRGSEIPLSQIEAVHAAAPAAVLDTEQPAESPAKAIEAKQEVAVAGESTNQPPVMAVSEEAAPKETAVPAAAVIEEVPAPTPQAAGTSAPLDASALTQEPSSESAALEETAAPVEVSEAVPVESLETATPRQSSYTEDMAVEDICQRMTIEEAQTIVVPSGTCKGWTMGQVADRRPASLKWYLLESSRMSNIIKAGATLLLDEIALKKAG